MTNTTKPPTVRRENLVEYGEGVYRLQLLDKLHPEPIDNRPIMIRYTIVLDSYRHQSVFKVEVWTGEWTEVWTLDPFTVEHHKWWGETNALKVMNRAVMELGAYARTILNV